jgi:hypothetical protein
LLKWHVKNWRIKNNGYCVMVDIQRLIWLVLVGCAGCSSPILSQNSAPVSTSSPSSHPSQATARANSSLLDSSSAQTSASVPKAAESAEIRRDYEFKTPLPATGRVTIRSHIRSLDASRLIADCPKNSLPYAFAESSNYQVQICSAENDREQPKYFILRAKNGGNVQRITSADAEAARQLIFRHQDHTYVIYRDGAVPEKLNAYLEIFSPDGRGFAEALLYLYEADPL